MRNWLSNFDGFEFFLQMVMVILGGLMLIILGYVLFTGYLAVGGKTENVKTENVALIKSNRTIYDEYETPVTTTTTVNNMTTTTTTYTTTEETNVDGRYRDISANYKPVVKTDKNYHHVVVERTTKVKNIFGHKFRADFYNRTIYAQHSDKLAVPKNTLGFK